MLFLVLSMVMFVGCSNEKNRDIRGSAVNNPNIRPTDDRYIEIWTDPDTGVEYIIYDRTGGQSGMGGITPRFNADGTLYRSRGEVK